MKSNRLHCLGPLLIAAAACLLCIGMNTLALGGSASQKGENTSEEGLAPLDGGLNYCYVSQDNFTSPINGSTIQGKNLTAEESLRVAGLTGPIVALRSNKNNKYVNVKREDGSMGE
jgi:hypothetical protein